MLAFVVITFTFLVSIFIVNWWKSLLREKEEMSSTVEENSEQKTAKALILHSKSGPYTVEHAWPRTKISPKELLIQAKAIGLNPMDWKCVTYGFGVHSVPWISGREAAGVVEEVGSEVDGFQKGDRVFVTSTNYRDNRTSTFQEYIAAKPFNVGRLPDWISFEEGATLGVGAVAAAGALFDSLAISQTLTPPGDLGSPWILIWGGSCVTGMMAIQLAKQSGYRVFAVADTKNATYLRSLGADEVFHRYNPDDAIARAQELQITLAVDCVGQETATYAARSLQPGGKLAYLVKAPDAETANEAQVEVLDILMKRFHEDAAYGQNLINYISHRLYSGTLRPIRHRTLSGGLERIVQGLEMLESGEVSGEKVVIVLDAQI